MQPPAAEHAPFVAGALLRSAKSNPSKILTYGGLIILLLAIHALLLPSLAWATHYAEAGHPELDAIAPHTIVGTSVRYVTGCGAPGIPSSGTVTSIEEGVQAVTEVMKRCISSPNPYVTVSSTFWGDYCGGGATQGNCAPRLAMPSGECADSAVTVSRYLAGYHSAESTQYPSVSGGSCKTIFVNYIREQQQYTIRLSSTDTASATGSIVSSVEPGKGANLMAYVYDQNGQLVPNVGIKLKLSAVEKSGGHHHGDNSAVERTGKLSSGAQGAVVSDNGKVLAGNTGAGGFAFSFSAPAVAGDIEIKAKCTDGKNCKQEGPETVWVGIKELLPIPTASTVYLLENRDGQHPTNHYLTREAEDRLLRLADLYHQRFPADPVLYLNDASLERGGLFDSYWKNPEKGTKRTVWWTPPHREHRRGTVIDIRANGAKGSIPVDDEHFRTFEDLAEKLHIQAEIHNPGTSNQHYHVRLMGVAE